MNQNNEVLAIAKHPKYGTDIVVYDSSWTHALDGHDELEDCEGKYDCLDEVVETLNNPDIIIEGRNPETEEVFIRYTDRVDMTTYRGYSVPIRTKDDITFMTTAYRDIIRTASKGKVKWKKGDNDE